MTVESFHYQPTIFCSPRRRLTAAAALSQLKSIPSKTPDGKPIFPQLSRAKLSFDTSSHTWQNLTLAVLRPPEAAASVGHEASFLENVRFLWIDSLASDSRGDPVLPLRLLGLERLKTVTVTMSSKTLPSATIPRHLNGQQSLHTVILDGRGYTAYEEHVARRGSMYMGLMMAPLVLLGSVIDPDYPDDYPSYLAAHLQAFWRERSWRPALKEIILLLDEEHWREILPQVQSRMVQDLAIDSSIRRRETSLREHRDWATRTFFWQVGNGPKMPLLG